MYVLKYVANGIHTYIHTVHTTAPSVLHELMYVAAELQEIVPVNERRHVIERPAFPMLLGILHPRGSFRIDNRIDADAGEYCRQMMMEEKV